MKKKLLIALLTITAALCCVLGFTACGEEKNNYNNETTDKWGNVYTVEAAYAVAA